MREAARVSAAGVCAGGVLLAAAAWWLTAAMAVDFAFAPTAAEEWRRAPFVILFAMWAVMMAAMMSPSALPFLRLFWRCSVHIAKQSAARESVVSKSGGGKFIGGESDGGKSVAGEFVAKKFNGGKSVVSKSGGGKFIGGESVIGEFIGGKFAIGESPAMQTAAVAGGYFLLWMLFSAAAALLHWAAEQSAMMTDEMILDSSGARAILFAAAGMYQLTPLKFACLRGCRPPPLMLILHWRRGIGGAFVVGAKNGAYCVGCCWALMLLLFAGGVMSLYWILALTLYALAERTFVQPQMLARGTGAGLLALSVLELIS